MPLAGATRLSRGISRWDGGVDMKRGQTDQLFAALASGRRSHFDETWGEENSR